MINFSRVEMAKFLFFLKDIFDVVRIIDYTNMRIVHYEDDDNIIHDNICYELWNRQNYCQNCVSRRAIMEGRAVTKTEFFGDIVYLVVSSPVRIGNDLFIFEMIKDITDTELVRNICGEITSDTLNTITKLSRKIVTDELTGVYNRRYINQRLEKDIKEAIKNEEKFSIIMSDIDYFKEINDIHGHLAGDLVLKTFANVVNSNIRKNYDWVARYGGDEFVIFLKNADRSAACRVIEKIRQAFRESDIVFNNCKIQTTISIGTYTSEGEMKNSKEILTIVDSNLSTAKKSGRNVVIST